MIVINMKALLYCILAIIVLIAIYVFLSILPSIPLNNGNVAKKLFEEYLDKYKSASLTENDRILEYEIDDITVTRESKSGFIFYVYFSVKPQCENTIWYGANGDWTADGWTRGNFLMASVSKEKMRYKIKEIGTGGVIPP